MIERLIARLGLALALVTLATLVKGMWQAGLRPKGRATGPLGAGLNSAQYLGLGSAFIALYAALWRPLPLSLSSGQRTFAALLGAVLYFPGLLLVLWSRQTLGSMYDVSSGLGAHLFRDHRLVTNGPYGLVRHPIYLGISLAAAGGLLIYRTWTNLLIIASGVTLTLRARNEERVLADEFGDRWTTYRQTVPAVLPRWRR